MTSKRGFCGIGIEHGKSVCNIGTLWRSAYVFCVNFLFTVGRRYSPQSSDTYCSNRHLPVFNFMSIDDLLVHLPYGTPLVGVESNDPHGIPIFHYSHVLRAVYLLGSEDNGLSHEARNHCHHIIQLPGERSFNVATAGSIVLFDRHQKEERRLLNGK